MTTAQQIRNHLESLTGSQQQDMQTLHRHILELLPGVRLWFDSGVNETGKLVTNPTIGYGEFTITYANGSSKPYFRVGISANASGISVYILGLNNKTYLAKTYAGTIGKAKITAYCIKFKSLKDISMDVLSNAVLYGMRQDKT